MSFAAMTRLAEGLCPNALLTLKVENYLIFLLLILFLFKDSKKERQRNFSHQKRAL
jgi:hypothetical protein